ncbi:hypothetical protein SERLA73DRAFT_185301 [Serpula lacrymans var. lacrymans S7.3]|uniref:NAD(P)-binding domain-containing protein n=2 Tax=Serpula lacrymans var. lacrymans TaxID=341189 RepID=F8Q4G5_SERL3|nr:uncharacterized protein SERLADRAFT_396101 [Serpula lacrymans var. lacrymans S7.9]EGN97020.1 hypothetical protein SERLA73DRAFT_185301 [Serpula lacrymans var. lacrymans S7.3]EGO22608.1 hypothetical protein SERLADRAFT_396101 [Serpula lacrymans var. lacrymans S7.9]
MPGQSALILGATGAVGQYLLKEILSSSHFTRVGEFGRRVTPADQLESVPGKQKLEQKTLDFEKLNQAGLKDGKWDVIFVTLGTTRAIAGSAANFEKIDREYVVNAVKEAKSNDPNHSQRIVYLSSTGANSSSPFLYPKSKGLTELALAGLGYKDTIVFRPALLRGRPGERFGETLIGYVTGALSHVSSNVEIQVPLLAKSIRNAGILGSAALPVAAEAQKAGRDGASFTLLNNKGTMALGNVEVNE